MASSSSSSNKEKGSDALVQKARKAADAVNDLISSMAMAVEEKVALQHQIANIARESEYMMDRIDSVAHGSQRKILLAYKKFLEENLDAVNQKLKEV